MCPASDRRSKVEMGVVERQCFGVEVVSWSIFVDFGNVEDGKREWEDTVDLLCLWREKTGMRDRRLDAMLMDGEEENLCAFANVDIRFIHPMMGWGGRAECLFIHSNAVHSTIFCQNGRWWGYVVPEGCSGIHYPGVIIYIWMDPCGHRRPGQLTGAIDGGCCHCCQDAVY